MQARKMQIGGRGGARKERVSFLLPREFSRASAACSSCKRELGAQPSNLLSLSSQYLNSATSQSRHRLFLHYPIHRLSNGHPCVSKQEIERWNWASFHRTFHSKDRVSLRREVKKSHTLQTNSSQGGDFYTCPPTQAQNR